MKMQNMKMQDVKLQDMKSRTMRNSDFVQLAGDLELLCISDKGSHRKK